MSTRRAVAIVVVILVLAFAVSAAGLALMWMSLGTTTTYVSQNSTLYLHVRAPLSEIEPNGLFSAFVPTEPSLRDTVDMLRKAARDSRVKALVVIPEVDGALWGQLEELHQAILDFKKSGKPAVAYFEAGSNGEYYLATACDRILMTPAGSLDLTGLAMYELFFRGALDKLGIYPDILHVGDYKTAANTFTEKGFTPAHREMDTSLNDDAFNELVHAIAVGRKRSDDEVRKLIDGGPYLAADAKRLGLIDDVAYEDQIDDAPPIQHTWPLQDTDYREVPLSSVGLGTGPRIALLYAVGTIASGKSSFDGASGVVLGSETFIDWLRTVRTDDSVKAIVVRIDSPGGSAIASDVIWRELMLTRDMKPLIISMGDVAASGGYYIAVPGTTIVAEPETLTGSIGVVTGKFALGGALDKIGVGTDSVTDGQFAGIDSPFTPFTPAERARVDAQMRATYDIFVSRVAQGRKMTRQAIDAIGQGRVWTGRQAKDRGLVDVLGTLGDAITIAKERAKLDPTKDVELDVYPKERTFADILANPFGADMSALRIAFTPPASKAASALASRVALFKRGEPLALMPNVFWR